MSVPGPNTALQEALLTGIEGTGLGASFGGDLSGLDGSWLQRAGSDGETGYWIRCRTSVHLSLPAGSLLRVTYLFPSANWPDRRDGQSDIEEVLDLALAGPQAGDASILAAVALAAVLGHQCDLTRRTP